MNTLRWIATIACGAMLVLIAMASFMGPPTAAERKALAEIEKERGFPCSQSEYCETVSSNVRRAVTSNITSTTMPCMVVDSVTQKCIGFGQNLVGSPIVSAVTANQGTPNLKCDPGWTMVADINTGAFLCAPELKAPK